MSMGVIAFDNVSFSYDGKSRALDGVNLHIERGEFVCILGGNGSGKSTLAKHVNALLAPDEGTVRVLDRDTRDPEDLFFIRSSAGMVFQNPDDQIVASVIEDDVAFGPENLGVELPELRNRVTAALEQVGLQGFETRETSALSGGQKQRVAIAGVLAMQPEILVLDEASAMLDPRGRAGLLRVCHELNDAGLTIVYITHFMDEVVEADRVIVLDRGSETLSGTPDEVLTQIERLKELHLDIPFAAQMSAALHRLNVPVGFHVRQAELERDLNKLLAQAPGANCVRNLQGETLGASDTPHESQLQPEPPVGAMVGHSNSQVSPRPASQELHRNSDTAPGAPAVQLESVSFTYDPAPNRKRRKPSRKTQVKPAKWGNDPEERWALRDVSLEVHQGDFLGLAGHTGSGKSTLIQIAAGLLQPATGQVKLSGVDLRNKREARAARSSVGLVFQYPERQLFAATVFDDVAFGPHNLGLAGDEVERRVEAALSLVGLSIDDLRERSPFTLSGGQQRRVAIAGVLAMEPHVLVMDEPTAGLDPASRESLLQLIARLHDQEGHTVVLVSHSMDDLARFCNRVILLNQGKLVAEGTPANVFADEASLKAIGLDMPHTAHLARALDMDVADHIPTVAELAEAIARRLRS